MDKKFGHKPLINSDFKNLTIEQQRYAKRIIELELERERQMCMLTMLNIMLDMRAPQRMAAMFVQTFLPLTVDEIADNEAIEDYNACLDKLEKIQVAFNDLSLKPSSSPFKLNYAKEGEPQEFIFPELLLKLEHTPSN